MLVVMAAAVGIVALMLVMMVMMHRRVHEFGLRGIFHRGADLAALQRVPGRGDDGRIGVLFLQQGHCRSDLFLAQLARAAQNDAVRALHLIVEELTEVFHINLALARVGHGDEGGKLQCFVLRCHALDRGDDVGELAHAARLDEDAVGLVLRVHLAQGLREITHQRAADAAAAHFADLHARVLQKAAVDGDLTELVFDQHELFARVGLLQQLLDERGLTCAEKAGNNVDFCHTIASFI